MIPMSCKQSKSGIWVYAVFAVHGHSVAPINVSMATARPCAIRREKRRRLGAKNRNEPKVSFDSGGLNLEGGSNNGEKKQNGHIPNIFDMLADFFCWMTLEYFGQFGN